MKYNKYDVITMENNNKYIVCDVIYEDNVIYLYLVNDSDDKDTIIIKEVDGILEPIKDSN